MAGPEGLGNVERPGMGEEKLDNAVYAIRGYADLADMAQAVGDGPTTALGRGQGRALLEKFEQDWWYGDDADSYADSLDDPGNEKVFQRHWIGLTPTDAVLPRLPGRPPARWRREHADLTLDRHERACFTGEFGLFHTGMGRPRPRRATRAPVATRRSRRGPASEASSPLTAR